LVKVTDWAARVTTYEYDQNGRLISTLRPNGTQQSRIYDKAGQLVQQKDIVIATGDVISQFDFRYDAAGNITQELVTPPPERFQFTTPVNMTYTAANRLATYNGEAVQFDADGNMTKGPLSDSLADFAFDSRNRLVAAGNTAYRYDAENQRTAVSIDGQETRYVVNSLPVLSQVLVRTQPDGTQTYYVHGLGLIGQEQQGQYLSYHFDFRGSTVALTDETGQVTERFQYSPYGLLRSGEGSTTPFLYNGMYGVITDASGLYYMRARYYHREIRRFVNQDILLGNIANGPTLNRYGFVYGNPVSYVDPEGHLGIISGIALGLGIWAIAEIVIPTLFPPDVEFESGEAIPSSLPDIVSGVASAAKTVGKTVTGKTCHIGSSSGSGGKQTAFTGDGGRTGCVIGTCALARTNFDRAKGTDKLTTWREAAYNADVDFKRDTLEVIERIDFERVRRIFLDNGMRLGDARPTTPYELLYDLKGKIIPGIFAVKHPARGGGHMNFLKVDSAGRIMMYDTNFARILSDEDILKFYPFTVYRISDLE